MPAKKQQKFQLDLPEQYSRRELLSIGQEVIDAIVDRSQNKHVDKNGKPFPEYSKSYEGSLNFKNAGKTGDVDLTLSGDMLAALQILNVGKGKLVIGFEKGTENDKAEGNILGTYGSKKENPKKARDFLGVQPKEIDSILEKYPIDRQEYSQQLVDFVFGGIK